MNLGDRGREVSNRLVKKAQLVPDLLEEGRYKATWKKEFKLPWRKAGPLKTFSGFEPVGCQ